MLQTVNLHWIVIYRAADQSDNPNERGRKSMKNIQNFVKSTMILGAFLPVLLHANEPIIDAHAHTFHPAGDIHWSGPELPPDATDEQKNKDKFRRTQAIWDQHNVVRAVTSGELDYTLRWGKADPERIVSGLILGPEPNTEEQFLNRIRSLARSGEIAVLGEIGFQYFGIAPNDPVMEIFYSLAEELDLPVALHMGPGPVDVHASAPPYRVSDGDPMLLEEALVRHPDMRIYVMHAGWPFLDNMIAIMTTYPQVYVGLGDVAHHFPEAQFHHYLKRLVDAGFGKRIMFGSDAYSPNPKFRSDPSYFISFEERYARGIERVRSASFLSDEQKRDIFYNNAVRFFRLSPE